MKIIVSALVALSVLVGIADPAGVVSDPKTFWDQQKRSQY
jgi:hypothetical protein